MMSVMVIIKGGIGMLESEAMAILVSAQSVTYKRREAAVSAAGSALGVLAEPQRYSLALGTSGVQAVRHALDNGDMLLETLRRERLSLLLQTDAGYPQRLLHIAQPPHLLFVAGQTNLNDAFPLAVVGTRSASAYGAEQTRSISRDLAAAGFCIVSGMALGVDAAAHMGALDAGGRTIAILGGAHDRLYPPENRPLCARIMKNGGSIVSEYAPGSMPTRTSFLVRNRIIAGMSLGVLVTEGADRSGAKNTAQHAIDNGREVFALPGDVNREGSALPNQLIADGAHLVTGAQSILSQLVIESAPKPLSIPHSESAEAPAAPEKPRKSKSTHKTKDTPKAPEAPKAEPQDFADLSPEERSVLGALRGGQADFDALCEATGLSGEALGPLLTLLEMDGRIESLPGLLYALA